MKIWQLGVWLMLCGFAQAKPFNLESVKVDPSEKLQELARSSNFALYVGQVYFEKQLEDQSFVVVDLKRGRVLTRDVSLWFFFTQAPQPTDPSPEIKEKFLRAALSFSFRGQEQDLRELYQSKKDRTIISDEEAWALEHVLQ